MWNAKCCCDYAYPDTTIVCNAAGGHDACCPTPGADPDAWVYEVTSSPGFPGFSRTELGRVAGGGWLRAVEYHFHVELTPRLLRIYRSEEGVNPELVFNYANPPSDPFDLDGTFAWYTASQPNVFLGPLELAGEMGFGTEGCATHETL